MASVKRLAAWGLLGSRTAVHGCRIEAAPFPVPDSSLRSSGAIGVGPSPPNQGGLVLDLLFIGLTIVVFAALWLLVKGVERFER